MRLALLVLAGALLILRAGLWWRGRIRVVGERDGTRILVRGRTLLLARGERALVQSRPGPGYVEGLHVGMLVRPQPRRVLFLGGGAFVGPRQFVEAYPEALLDVVELEPLVVRTAERHFGLRPTPRLRVHVGDAAAFVRASRPAAYDLVVHDVYDAVGMPVSVTTAAFFADLARVLAPGGALVVNAIRQLDGDALVAAIQRALPEHAIATYDVPGHPSENALILAAPELPTEADSPFVAELLARRR